MNNDAVLNNDRKMTSIFERFLSLWVVLCIVAGILLGKIAPGVAQYLDSMAIYVKGAPLSYSLWAIKRPTAAALSPPPNQLNMRLPLVC